jgi:hypothetical protein
VYFSRREMRGRKSKKIQEIVSERANRVMILGSGNIKRKERIQVRKREKRRVIRKVYPSFLVNVRRNMLAPIPRMRRSK